MCTPQKLVPAFLSCGCGRFAGAACVAAVTPVVYYDRVTGGEADRPAASAVQSVQGEDPASDILASGGHCGSGSGILSAARNISSLRGCCRRTVRNFIRPALLAQFLLCPE